MHNNFEHSSPPSQKQVIRLSLGWKSEITICIGIGSRAQESKAVITSDAMRNDSNIDGSHGDAFFTCFKRDDDIV